MPSGHLIGRINPLRVLVGGFLAGLIIVAGEYVLNAIVLGAEFAAQREKLGLGAPTPGELAVGATITIVYGVVLIWIYAAIRPRFGPGPNCLKRLLRPLREHGYTTTSSHHRSDCRVFAARRRSPESGYNLCHCPRADGRKKQESARTYRAVTRLFRIGKG